MRETHRTRRRAAHRRHRRRRRPRSRRKGADVRRFGRGGRAAVAAPDPRTNPTHGYDVFRPWSLTPAPCPGTCVNPLKPLKEIYEDYRLANTDIVRKVVYGKSLLGQDLVAYRADPRRDAVPAAGASRSCSTTRTQHAREWLSAEVNRRLFKYFLDHKNDAGTAIPQILRSTEVWFVPIVNPDGYDYTFVSAGHALLAQEPARQQRRRRHHRRATAST